MKVKCESRKDSLLHKLLPRSGGGEGYLSALTSVITGRSGYGAPLWLFAAFVFIVAYAVFTREAGPASGRFPRAGAAFLETGRLDSRLARLNERIRSNPNDIQALLEAGILKFQKGPASYIDAISDLETARSNGAADVRVFYYLGRMYQAVGLYDFALEEYRRLLNNRPDDFEVRMLAAKLLFAAGKYPQAVREYEALSEAHTGNILVLENLALSRWKNKQDPKPVLDKLGGLGPEAAFRARYISGRMAYENKDYAAAAPFLARAAAESAGYPDFSDLALVYQMLGDSYIKLKSDAGAIFALTELLKINPSNEEARSQLARLIKTRQRAAKENAKKAKERGKK
jgi:tetratricopeptide (TPR) repeat protein